ncbi:STN domain-containing protein [Desulfocastanea catecholica]
MINLKKLVLPIISVVCLLLSQSQNSFAIDMNCLEQHVTISINKTELSSVLKELSNKTGLEIIYSKELANKVVSGAYSNKPLDTVIRQMLRGTNYSLIYDNNGRLWIKSFGETTYVRTTTNNRERVYEETGLTTQEMEQQYRQNMALVDKERADDSKYVEIAGMTQGELVRRYEESVRIFNDKLNDDANLLPGVGMSRGAYQDFYDNMIEKINQRDDEKVLPDLNITIGELTKTHEEQVAHINQQKKSGDLYIEELGMTAGEYKILYDEYMSDL